jgi:hypothetical protein
MAAPERFDPYRVLGVGRDATPQQLARAYRAQAKQVHPDLHGPEVARQMQDLNRAWQVLSDPARRRAWDASHPTTHGGRHWSTGGIPAPAAQRADPAAWAAWEAARPATVPGPDRIRVAESWPRRADAPAAPAGMRDSAWLAGGVAAVLVVAILVLGYIASSLPGAATAGDALALAGIEPVVRVSLDPQHELAVYRTADGSTGVAVVRLRGEGWDVGVLEERAGGGGVSVHLAADAGGSAWRSIVYGNAPAGAARVRLSVDSTGGEVADGLWAIGVRSPLRPEQLGWRFEAADGSVVLSGSGERD